MALNRSALIEHAVWATGNRDDIGDKVKVWFNWALRRIDRMCDIKGLEVRATASTVIDQKVYALPSDCKYVETLRVLDDTQSKLLRFVSAREFDQAHPYPEGNSTEKPLIYVPYETTFELYPIPNAVYTLLLRYWKWQDDLENDTDFPEISYADDIIIKALIVEIWEQLEELQKKRDALDNLYLGLQSHKYVMNLRPDWTEQARGFTQKEGKPLDYLTNPFYRGD
jgi:hypothetical protein